jgi:hypothetical protein
MDRAVTLILGVVSSSRNPDGSEHQQANNQKQKASSIFISLSTRRSEVRKSAT